MSAREVVQTRLREGLIDDRPEIPQLPRDLGSRILFRPESTRAKDRGWVEPMPIADFDRQLAEEVLIPLACAPDAPAAIARNIALRAIDDSEDGRLYPGIVAKALLGHACRPAKELDERAVDSLRRVLRGYLLAQMQRLKQSATTPPP